MSRPGITPLSERQKSVLRIFSDATLGWCDVWSLMGGRHDDIRQEIMEGLLGEPVALKDCGVIELRDRIRYVLDVADGDAHKVQAEIAKKVKAVLA